MTILDALDDPELFASWYRGESWDAWRVFLMTLFGLGADFGPSEQVTFMTHTGRETPPVAPYKEAWCVVGRRGGKSLVAATAAVFIATCRDHSAYLQHGETGTVALIAADKKQARVAMRYVKALLELPILAPLVTNTTAESVELYVNGSTIQIEVHTCSFRSVRGYTLLAAVCDEIAFWKLEDTANPDKEVLAALRPALMTIPNSLLLAISSPYARRGQLWEQHSRHFGKDTSNVLVWWGSSRAMNPTLDQALVDQAMIEDEQSARAEYLAIFRGDVETFVSLETLYACRVVGRTELGYDARQSYVAFSDPSGGSADSMALCISHKNYAGKLVLDLLDEVTAPFNPETVVERHAEILKRFRIHTVTGDAYAGTWPRVRFSSAGITYEVSEFHKNQIYLDALVLLNSHKVELLDHPKLLTQMQLLERRTGKFGGGRDVIDHPVNGKDDVANAAMGACLLASRYAYVEAGGIF